MKEIYAKPVAEIEEFATVDVVTTSAETVNGNENQDAGLD
jgi:hypothetical protein